MKPIRSRFVALTLLSAALGCSSGTKSPDIEAPTGPEPHTGLETLVVLGTNDIHGGLAPFSLVTRESGGTQPVPYEAGGAAVLASYVNILRSEFKDHFIWLDGGDEFQGSIESNLDQGAPMVQFFNATGLNAAAVGNHEFDFGISNLKSRMREAHYPYLAANISEQGSGQPVSFPNTHPHVLLKAGNLKVGVIGLSTVETPITTPAGNVRNLQFDDLKATTLREAKTLRKLGAQLVLVTGHIGLKCDPGQTHTGRLMRKTSDPQGQCGDQDEVVQLIRSLPTGTVDAVVAGHTHQIVHHWVGDVPVIEAGAFGRYVNVLYLTYDWSAKKLLLDETRIEGPVPVCTHVFQNQNDCNGDRPAPKNGRGPLIPSKFHGTVIHPDPKITALIEPVLKKSEVAKGKVLGTAVRPIEHNRAGESELGNLVADAVREAVDADFAYMNGGGIRAPIEAGPITYGSVFRALPFDNRVAKIEVTVKQLELILRIAQSGSRGFGSISGLRLKLIDPAYPAPFENLNGDSKNDLWEANRLLAMTLSNGRPLDPNQIFTLATTDFLVTGGDDLKWVMSQIAPEKIHVVDGPMVRDVVVRYIEKSQALNGTDHPLLDPAHPRLKFEKVSTRPKSEKKGRRRKS